MKQDKKINNLSKENTQKKKSTTAKENQETNNESKKSSTEYKSPVQEKPSKIELTPEKRKKLRITESKIKKMLNVEHLEELFYILNILDDKQIALFLQHYKNSEIEKSKDKKIDTIINNSENYHELLESLKTELTSQLSGELEDLKTDISGIIKKGIDTTIESMKSMSIKSKIRIFSATGKKEDFYKVKKMLHTLDETLNPKRTELKRIEEQKKLREKAFEEKIKKENEKRKKKYKKRKTGKT